LGLLVQQFLFESDPAPDLPGLVPRYNVAPTQITPIVRRKSDGGRELLLARWGLIPAWAKDPKIGYSTINARADSVATKPVFRSAFKKRRCLVPVDGYYEWISEGKKKLPILYEQAEHRPFALAGLWESWRGPTDTKASGNQNEGPVETFTIVTTTANDLASRVHDRMPVILDPVDYDGWLDPKLTEEGELEYLLRPYEGELVATNVNPIVNNVKNDVPQCIEPRTNQGYLPGMDSSSGSGA
jgi:putative SOS response-associated peptidase YedK